MAISREYDLDIYFDYYSNYTKKRLSKYYVSRGTLNTGVMFVPEDYTSLWFDIFSKTIPVYGVKGHPGQGVGIASGARESGNRGERG